MNVFMAFAGLCWIGLIVFVIKFFSRQRNKTLLLRSFIRIAKNQSPERWVKEKITENSGLYYSTGVNGFCFKIEARPVSSCHRRMFVSGKTNINMILSGSKIEELYRWVANGQKISFC